MWVLNLILIIVMFAYLMSVQYNCNKVKERVQDLEIQLVEAMKYNINCQKSWIDINHKNLIHQGLTRGEVFDASLNLKKETAKLLETVHVIEAQNKIKHIQDNKFKPKNAKS